MQTLNNILSEISRHPIDEKEMIAEILNKRLIEEKRELIYNEYKRVLKNCRAGKVKSGNVDDLFKTIGR